MTHTCHFIGAEQTHPPYTECGAPVFPGKSYCQHHLWKVYKKGTSVGNKKKIASIERELASIELAEEVNAVYDE